VPDDLAERLPGMLDAELPSRGGVRKTWSAEQFGRPAREGVLADLCLRSRYGAARALLAWKTDVPIA
jgi:hypothetical protein